MEKADARSMGARARRPFAPVRVAAASACTFALAWAALAACLPDLAALPPEPTPFEAGSRPFRGCGDGVIESLDDGGDAGESCDPGDAGVKGCSACHIACEGVVDPRSGNCYFAIEPTSSYNAALTRCRAENAHVVTVASEREAELVASVAGATTPWIGFSFNPGRSGFESANEVEPGLAEPGTSGPCPGCFAPASADAGSVPVDGDASAATASCIVARSATTWARVPCTGATFATVCEREPAGLRAPNAGNCSGGFCFNVVASAGGKTYLLASSAADSEGARAACTSIDGGSLVVLASREEREQLAREVLAKNPFDVAAETTFWIGLAADAGSWTWDDGVPADGDAGARPLPWGNAQPPDAAVARAYIRLSATAYDTQLAYADPSTSSVRLYVCQAPPSALPLR